MGSKRPPCPRCGGYLIRDHDLLDDGETVQVIKCVNCGERIIPPPKITDPSPEYAYQITLPTPCKNCDRDHVNIYALGLCDFCWDHRDNLEDARWRVRNGMLRQRGVRRAKRNRRERAANDVSEVRV